jgi:nucleoside 2-deoxyribosyltransferase
MWFDKQTDDAWEKGIKQGILDTRFYSPMRSDKVEHNSRIDDWIIAEIRSSGLLVADCTGDRAGVYFEAGYALGLGLPVIWTCRRDWLLNVHFDANHYNFIDWAEPEELRARLASRIAATAMPRPKA